VLLSVQHKKANWDLRRDCAKKLEKLDKRTQRAMIELMRLEDEKRTAEAAGQA
jgi:coiled-coil domain-containing protein 12